MNGQPNYPAPPFTTGYQPGPRPLSNPEGGYIYELYTYAGPLRGTIRYYYDESWDLNWWNDGEQWRVWKGSYWGYSGYRSHYAKVDLWTGVVLAGISLVIGAIVGLGAMPLFAILAVISIMLGFFNAWLHNNHPAAYRAMQAYCAVSLAQDLRNIGRGVRKELGSDTAGLRQASEDFARREIGRR